MFGLGGQEILLLLCCFGLPLAAAVVAVLVTRKTKREPDRDDDPGF